MSSVNQHQPKPSGDRPVGGPLRPVRWGVISDVHGNLAALERALQLLEENHATHYAFLGDYLGGRDSDACVCLIRDVAHVAVAGNRDFEWQDRVGPQTRAWVLALPRSTSVDGMLLVHGDVRLTPKLGTAEISRGLQRPFQLLEQSGERMLLFGHSHHARVWRKMSITGVLEQCMETAVHLDPAFRYFVNVGTTGLPFPGRGGPSVALIDLTDGRATIHMLPLTGTVSATR